MLKNVFTPKEKKAKNTLLIGLCLLLFLTPLIYFGEIRGAKEAKDFLGQVIILLLFIIWLIKSKKITFRLNKIDNLILVFASLILLSFILSQNYYLSFLGLKKWFSYILIYILAISIIDDFKSVRQIFYVLVGVSFLTGLFGIMNFYGIHFDSAIQESTGRGRVISTFGNPNYLSSFIGPVLPLNLYLLFTVKDKRLSFILFAAFSIIYTTLLFTRTRGVLLGLIFITCFIGFTVAKYLDKEYLLKQRKKIFILLILIIVLTTIFSGDIPFAEQNMGSLASRFERNAILSSGNHRRIMMWLITGEMIKDSPVLGKGIGTYEYMYPQYQKGFLKIKENRDYRPLAGRAIEAHNEYLQIGAESGVLAVVIFLAILIYTAYLFFIKMPYGDQKQNLLLIILGSSLLVIAIHSLVSFPLRLMQTGILFWVLLAITNNFLDLKVKELDISSTVKQKNWKIIKIAISCFLMVLVLLTTSKFISDRKLVNGWQQEMRGKSMRAKNFYQQAVKYNPYDGRVRERLGAIYSKLGWFEKAERELKLAQKNIISKETYNEIGMNFGRQGLHNKAIRSFEKAVSYYPSHSNSYLNVGLANKVLARRLLNRNKEKSGIKKLKESLLYLEQAKIFTRDEEQKRMINNFLVSVVDLLFNYAPQYSEKLRQVDYEIYVPKTKLPVIDLIEEKALDTKRVRVRLLIYGEENSYQNFISKRVSNFKQHVIGNVKIIEFIKKKQPL